MDPFQGLADFVLGWMKKSATAMWLRLLFTMSVSASITLCFFTGTVTLTSGSLKIGFATGLVMTSLVLLAQFKLSPLTKGLTIALPQEIVDDTAKQQIEVIAGGNLQHPGSRQFVAPAPTVKPAAQPAKDGQQDPVARLFNQ